MNARQRATRVPRSWSAFDADYWLRRCEGFEVVSPDRRLGYVEEVRFGSRIDRPDAIVFRSRLRRRLVVVPISEIDDIEPARERITLLSVRARKEGADVHTLAPADLQSGPDGRRAA